jgi:Protein of unknown function (DUF3304)
MNQRIIKLSASISLSVVILVTMSMTACTRVQQATAQPSDSPTLKAPKPLNNDDKPPTFKGVPLYTGPHRTPKGMEGLTLHAYNYTDTYIDSYSVNGAGGGNVEVSVDSAGGSGGACCAPVRADMPLPTTVEIKWKRDGDVPYCRQTVLLDGPIPAKPNNFEVHFYPDGTIQVAITDSPSEARLKLERFNRLQRKPESNINNDSKYSECDNGR